MSTTPAPTINEASIQTQVQVFISYSFTSIAVAYFIIRLALSICKKSFNDHDESAEADTFCDASCRESCCSCWLQCCWYKCCCSVKNNGQLIIFWSSFVTVCLFFYRSILIWGGMLYHLAGEDNNAGDNTAFAISFTGYALGLWVMLYTFVARMDYTFRGSYLAYSVNTIRALYVFVFLILLLVFVLVGYEVVDMYDTVSGVLLPLILSIHFLFFVMVSCLLFSKVFMLIRKKVHQSEATTNEENDDESGVIDLGNIDSFTRYALLMSVGISSTYVFTVINAITLGLENEHPIKTWGVGYSLVGADLFVNALVVYLLFPMNTAQYYLCCSLCHGCCRKCCMNCVYAQMKRNNATDKNKEQFVELILSK